MAINYYKHFRQYLKTFLEIQDRDSLDYIQSQIGKYLDKKITLNDTFRKILKINYNDWKRYKTNNLKSVYDLLETNNIYAEESKEGKIIYVAHNNSYVGSILICDEVKEEAKDVISYLTKTDNKTIMLTGDNEQVASFASEKLGLTSYRSSLLPQDKVEEVEKLLKEKKENDVLCFVGDGINAGNESRMIMPISSAFWNSMIISNTC